MLHYTHTLAYLVSHIRKENTCTDGQHTRPHNCASSAIYSPCAKKPPRVWLRLFKLHSEDMFSHNAPHWHSPGKQLGALLKVCTYSTGFMDLFRRLVLKHNPKFRELNLFRPSGETVGRHPTQKHSLERISPSLILRIDFFSFGDTVSLFHAPHYHSLFCLTLLQITHVFAQGGVGVGEPRGRQKSADLKQAPHLTVEFCGKLSVLFF